MQKIIHNVQTDEVELVDLTDSEIAKLDAERIKRDEIEADRRATIDAELAAKKAVFEKLGLTAEEIQLLIG